MINIETYKKACRIIPFITTREQMERLESVFRQCVDDLERVIKELEEAKFRLKGLEK